VGQEGRWTITAHDPEQGQLTYSIDWGDGDVVTTDKKEKTAISSQSASFPHTYYKVGTYKIVFTVTDNVGQSVNTTTTIRVGNIVCPTDVLSCGGDIFVGRDPETCEFLPCPEDVPTINVTYPNGGEILYKGQKVNVTWETENFGDLKVSIYVDNSATGKAGELTHIAVGTENTGSYEWTVPTDIATDDYRLYVVSADKGPTVTDSSDGYFSITSPMTGGGGK
jgi:hypothetical protein